jgi:hypothetical protein
MTDAGHGPGWWLASDGRYYPPASHPDPAHRLRWASDPAPTAPPSEAPTIDLSVATTPAPAWEPGRPSAAPERVPVPPVARPPVSWPAASAEAPAPPQGNVAAASTASVGALVAGAGTFLAWSEVRTDIASLSRNGWQLGADGRFTLAAAVVAAAAAGVAWAGVRHVALRFVLAAAAVVLLAVFVVDLVDVLDARDTPGLEADVRIGLWMIGGAGVLLAVAAALERSPLRLPRR